MIKNYFKSAWNSLKKNKFFSFAQYSWLSCWYGNLPVQLHNLYGLSVATKISSPASENIYRVKLESSGQ